MNLPHASIPPKMNIVHLLRSSDHDAAPSEAPQLTPADLTTITKRLIEHADSIENLAAQMVADDLRLASRVIQHLMSAPADLLVDVTGEDGTTKSNVPLREAVGNDQLEYLDCHTTLLFDGKCTTGGGATPLYHLTLVGNR
jgi:hypothetical protein